MQKIQQDILLGQIFEGVKVKINSLELAENPEKIEFSISEKKKLFFVSAVEGGNKKEEKLDFEFATEFIPMVMRKIEKETDLKNEEIDLISVSFIYSEPKELTTDIYFVRNGQKNKITLNGLI